MARVLAYTSPARGHLFPVTPVLDELRGRGHDVALRTLASPGRADAGAGSTRHRSTRRSRRLATTTTAPARPGRPRNGRCASSAAPGRLDAPDLRRAIDEERPDLLLVDPRPGAPSRPPRPGAALGILVSLSAPRPLPGHASLRPRTATRHEEPRAGFGTAAFGRSRSARSTLDPPAVNAAARESACRRSAGAADLFLAAPLVLYMTAEPFEYPRSDWPATSASSAPATGIRRPNHPAGSTRSRSRSCS